MKRLGGVPDSHKRSAEVHRDEAARLANRSVVAKECGDKFNHLINAVQEYGKMQAHAIEASKGGRRVELQATVRDDLASAEGSFRQRCGIRSRAR